MIEWILSSCILIAAIALLRLVFKGKISSRLQYALWGLVLLRLLVPFNFFESPVSTENLVVRVERQSAVMSAVNSLNTPAVSYDAALHQAQAELEQSGNGAFTQTALKQRWQAIMNFSTPAYIVKLVLYAIWFAGIAVTAICFLISNIRFSKHLKTHRQPLEVTDAICKVYTCDGLDTPCLFGLIHPAIYLTPEEAADEVRMGHIIAHETTHLRQFDHIWSALQCVCLVLHWYNPLVWLAATLSRRDCELACDEATIRRIGEDQRISYGTTLIEMTCTKSSASGLLDIATTMTGSQTALKERVKMIAKKPKTVLYALIAVLLIAAVTAGCTFSGVGNWADPTYPITSGAAETEPQEEVELPVLTEEKQLELEKDFPYKFMGDPSYWWYSEDMPYGARYYGTFEGCDFLFYYTGSYKEVSSAESTYYWGIADEYFISNNEFVIDVVSEVEAISDLGYMYNEGYVSQETVQKIAQIHNAYEKELGRDWNSIYPNLKKLTPANIIISEKKKQEIENALGGWYYSYYGTYEGYDILFQSTPLTALGTIEIAGEYFRSGNIANLYGYRNGELSELKQLYEDGLISQNSIHEIVQVHMAYNRLREEAGTVP